MSSLFKRIKLVSKNCEHSRKGYADTGNHTEYESIASCHYRYDATDDESRVSYLRQVVAELAELTPARLPILRALLPCLYIIREPAHTPI